jgi:shikimate kinase
MGAGKSTIGRELAERLGRSFRDVDAELEHLNDRTIGQLFEESGEQRFRELEAAVTREVITDARPAVIALGGGAVTTPEVRDLLRAHAFTLLVAVDVDEAWERSRGTDRPLARDETEFRRLYEARQPLYEEVANGAAADVAGAVLAAGNVVVEAGAFARLGELAPSS